MIFLKKKLWYLRDNVCAVFLYSIQHDFEDGHISLACSFCIQQDILDMSEKYVKMLAKDTENTIDGPYSGRLTGYGKIYLEIAQKNLSCTVVL